jgi:hypothetical protein
MNQLMKELQTGPPQWIVYQRQLVNIAPLEKLFNHGQPSVQRDLDEMIMQKIATGQWQLVDKKDQDADSIWCVIRTGRHGWPGLAHGKNEMAARLET